MSDTESTQVPDRERFRSLLLAERERLLKQLRKLETLDQSASQGEEVGELAHYDEHEADVATETFLREQDQAIQRSLQDELHQVEAALNRIQDGTYGRCERCGKPIDPERLELLPYVTLCVEDANRIEGQI
ncbi:MAG: TraR/DksA C4-type zinc finger protein [Armatimonadetes bacterium]|nr:TraR/DksA C4-type zinc finger protein [Armatimonadota bacterium]